VDCYIWYSEEETGRGPQPAQEAPPRCTKCNSPPINGQCTNFNFSVPITVLLRNGPLLCGFNVGIKGLRQSQCVGNKFSTIQENVNYFGVPKLRHPGALSVAAASLMRH